MIYFGHVIHDVDVYIFLKFVVIFSEFFELLCSVLRVSPDTDPSRRDRSISVPAESAAETATVNHDSTNTLSPSISTIVAPIIVIFIKCFYFFCGLVLCSQVCVRSPISGWRDAMQEEMMAQIK